MPKNMPELEIDKKKNTVQQIKWKRNCPGCNKEIFHTKKWVRDKFDKLQKKCKSCGSYNKGKILDLSVKEKISNANRGMIRSLEARMKMSISQTGRKHTEETKQKMSKDGNGMYGVHRYDTQNPFHGKTHTNEARRKMRIAACKRVLELQRNDKDGRINNIGLKEGEYFDSIEKERSWNGIYYKKSKKQFLVENIGYFVDYYEPNLNIVVEYDEPRHYVYGNLKVKDTKRMIEIKNYLRCKFFRFSEYTRELKEF